MNSLNGITRVVPSVGVCTTLTWQINVSFEAPGYWNYMATLLVGQGSGLEF